MENHLFALGQLVVDFSAAVFLRTPDHVRSSVIRARDGQLIRGQEVIRGRMLPVDGVDVPEFKNAIGLFDGYFKTPSQQPVKIEVGANDIHTLRAANAGDRLPG